MRRLSCILIPLLAMAACDKSSMTVSDRTLSLSLHQCSNAVLMGNRITICMDSVLTDSRCPANALCIWQGYAAAQFSMLAAGETYPFTLSTLKLNGYLSKDTVISGYRLSFQDLTPYPGTVKYPVPNSQVKASLQVSKL